MGDVDCAGCAVMLPFGTERKRTVWVEVCAGSCSMSAHLLGWTRRPVPWMGTKWRYRRHLEALARSYGLVGVPRCVVYDAGPVADIAPQLMRSAVARELAWDIARPLMGALLGLTGADSDIMTKGPEGAAYKLRVKALEGHPPTDPDQRAAHGAVMCQASFGGRGIEERGAGWRYPASVGRTCRLGALARLVRMPSVPIESERRANARPHGLPPGVHPSDCVVLLDPPYDRRTGYPDDMPRETVMELANEWRDAGAAVLLTEAEPVMGWTCEPLRGDRSRSGMSIPEIVEHAAP